MRTYAVIFFFLGCFFSNALAQGIDPCENIKVQSKIINTNPGQDNGSIDLLIEGGLEPYTVFAFGDNRSKNKLSVKSTNIENLKKGQYLIIIQDKSGCRKELKIEIK